MFCNPLVSWSKDCNFWFKGTLAEKSALFCLSQGKPPPPQLLANGLLSCCVCAYLHIHLLSLAGDFIPFSTHVWVFRRCFGFWGDGAGCRNHGDVTQMVWPHSAVECLFPMLPGGSFWRQVIMAHKVSPSGKWQAGAEQKYCLQVSCPVWAWKRQLRHVPTRPALPPKGLFLKPSPDLLVYASMCTWINNGVKWHVLCGGSRESPVLTGKDSSSSAMHKAERPWRRLLELPLCIHQEGECLLILGN